MGPENSPPTYLCYINPETGEQHKLMGLVENISLTEVEGFEHDGRVGRHERRIPMPALRTR